MTVGQQDKINIPSCHEDAILSERISSFFNQAKINRHLTKLPKKLLRHNILAVLFRNRIDISEPNSEAHVIRLPDEISPKICAALPAAAQEVGSALRGAGGGDLNLTAGVLRF